MSIKVTAGNYSGEVKLGFYHRRLRRHVGQQSSLNFSTASGFENRLLKI